MITRKFRSILVNNVEKIIPGTVFSKMVIEMDESTIMEHELNLSPGQILTDRSWIIYFFFAFMAVAFVSAMIFGLLFIGLESRMEPESWNILELIFFITAVLIFFALWISLSVRGSIEHLKREFVEEERGKANWRLVDESKWEEFYKLLQISKRSREKELEDFMNKKLK